MTLPTDIVGALVVLRRRLAEALGPHDRQDPPPLLLAEHAAWQAVDLIILAFERGAERGGSIEWSDLERAHDAASEAVRIRQKGPFR